MIADITYVDLTYVGYIFLAFLLADLDFPAAIKRNTAIIIISTQSIMMKLNLLLFVWPFAPNVPKRNVFGYFRDHLIKL